MANTQYIHRSAESALRRQIDRGRSVLLLGPRQTGKTTLVGRLPRDLYLSLVFPGQRQRYERDPGQLLGEIEALRGRESGKPPLVVIDEVQKVPPLLDAVQAAIDGGRAQFLLTGSSARKLRRGGANLLPGRVVILRLDPLSLGELTDPDLSRLLTDGSFPAIWQVGNPADRETDLGSYVEAYLEEEIRAEALVRSMGSFARFLELAGTESGNIVSFRAIAQDVGVSHTTISSYYEILEDCMVAERIDPLTKSATRKKLTRSSRYVIFDMGVRRLCAREGRRVPRTRRGDLLQQLVGLELIRLTRFDTERTAIRFWRDPDGPEVDWVVDRADGYLPIEVKWTDTPGKRDVRHLQTFLKEYPGARRGFVVCRVPRRVRLSERIDAVPWQDLPAILD